MNAAAPIRDTATRTPQFITWYDTPPAQISRIAAAEMIRQNLRWRRAKKFKVKFERECGFLFITSDLLRTPVCIGGARSMETSE